MITPACRTLRSLDETARPPRAGRRHDEPAEKLHVPGRTVQRGKERQAEAGQEGARRASRDDSAGDEGGSLRWDKLGADERRSWSAQIAAKEARAQGLPTLASPAQHRLVAALFAKASTTAPADVAAGEPS